MVGARTEVLVHCLDHGFGALVTLGLTLWQQVEVRNLRCGEQVGGTIRARSNARTTTNTLGRVHRGIGHALRNRNEVGIGSATGVRRDEST